MKAASGLRKTFTKRIPHCRRKRRLSLINTWLPPTISQERLQWRIYWHQLLQTKQHDDFELYVTKDRFYKANATLPTKTPTDFIRDCRLLFHKNDYSDEFIDTNYYKQNKQNDHFELYVTKDRFYKAYGTLPTKTPTDFDKYVTAV